MRKKAYLLLVVLCMLVLTAKADVGDVFTKEYYSGSTTFTVKYEVTGTSPNTVRTVEQVNYFLNIPDNTVVVIPETVENDGVNYTVTEVGSYSFHAWKGISLSLPNTVTSIADHAFYQCEIPSISIGTGVTSIGNMAFKESKLTEIELPEGLTTIDKEAFCSSSVTKITLPESLTSLGESCFKWSQLQSIVVPEGVTSIGNSCFYECQQLLSASLPSTLQEVPQSCFYNCRSLSDLTLSSGIQTLYNECFKGCTALKKVTIPASVTGFGNQSSPFHGCSNISEVTLEWTEIPQGFKDRKPFEAMKQNITFHVPKGYEQAYATALDLSTTDNINPSLLGQVFTAEVSGQTVTFKVTDYEGQLCQVGDGEHEAINYSYDGSLSMPATVTYQGLQFAVTKVGDNAFKDTDLTGFSFSGITEVGDKAFKNSHLASLDLGAVTTIGDEAFFGCKFTTVDLSNVEVVGNWAFAYGSFTTVDLSNVDVVGNWAFAYGKLTSVQLSSTGGNEARGAFRRAPGGGTGPGSIGEGSFSNNSIGSVDFSASRLTEVPNRAFSNNQISSLDLGNVQSVGDYSFYNNKLTKLNTKNVTRMGEQAFGKNQLQMLEFGPGAKNAENFPEGLGNAKECFGFSSELAGVLSIVCGEACAEAIAYFFGSYGGACLAAAVAVTAVSAVVWHTLMNKRKKNNDEDDFTKLDTPSFVFTDLPQPTETCLRQLLPFDMHVPDGMEAIFTTQNCSVDQKNKTVVAGDQPGQASLRVQIQNKSGYHYEGELDKTQEFTVSDTDECDPDKDQVPSMTFLDRNVYVPRGGKVNVMVKYTNMTYEEASKVVFALKAAPGSESVLDNSMLNYMTVKMKMELGVNDGWPYAEISASADPVSMANLIGIARHLTATLDVKKYRNYHLTDQTPVMAMETPNPNIMLYEDVIQVGDVIALPRFCTYFPTCWLMWALTIPASELVSLTGYQRYAQEESVSDGLRGHRGVPFIQYFGENGTSEPNPLGVGPAVVEYSRSNIKLADVGSLLNPDHELMVDTVFVRGQEPGRVILRFTDPYWLNIYFNIGITCVEPHTEAPAANPVTWDFTQPPTDELKDNALRQQSVNGSTACYWTKKDDYYSADMGYYGLRYGSSDRKWAPFFGNNGKNVSWFEGIEQSVVTQPEDDEHTTPYTKQWHTAKDHIRIYDGRAEGEPQVAFVGQTDLRIKRPVRLDAEVGKDYVSFKVKAKPLGSGSPSMTCSYTYTDAQNQKQTYSQTVAPTADNTEFTFQLYTTVDQYISLSLTDVELSSLLIDGPATMLYDKEDNTETIASINKLSGTVALSGRTLYKDGSWNTLCLPFDVVLEGSPLEGATVKTLSSASLADGTLTLNFTDKGAVSEIEAGRPYIIKWDNTGVNLTEQDLVFQGVTIESGTTDKTCDLGDERSITFKGTFSPAVIYESGDKHNLYLGNGNTLYYPTTEGFALKSCRAYFKLNGLTAGEPSSPSNVRAFSLNFGDEATGIVSIGNGQLTIDNEADAWYSLGGVRLGGKPTQKGVYINNGRKVVIK